MGSGMNFALENTSLELRVSDCDVGTQMSKLADQCRRWRWI